MMYGTMKHFHKGDRGGPGSLAMQEDDARQRELAVIELAEKVVRTTCENSRALMIKALRVAVNDLTAHQPVDPQTLEPGTRFRLPERGDSIWVLIRYRGGAKNFAIDEGGYLCDMDGVESVLPITEETE